MQKEVYVLSNDRSVQAVERFLERYLPCRHELAAEYQVPQFSDDPQHVFRAAGDLLAYLERNETEFHGVYWQSVNSLSPVDQAMAFYTSDGCVVCGLVVSEQMAEAYLNELKLHFDSKFGLIDEENPPPDTGVEFVRRVENRGSVS